MPGFLHPFNYTSLVKWAEDESVNQHWVDWTLMQRAESMPLAEVLQVRCIHGDMREYPMLLVWLHVVG